jgi:hypothetical protein
MLVTFDGDSKYPTLNVVPLPISFEPLDNFILDESSNYFHSIVTAGNKNIFLNFNDYKVKTTVVNVDKEKEKPLLIPASPKSKNNFVVDKENKKAYFVYSGPSKNYLTLLKVGY